MLDFDARYSAVNPGPSALRIEAVATPELVSRSQLRDSFALEGAVLGPEQILDPGYLIVGKAGLIEDVRDRRPEGVRIIRTGGVIIPGLIDLHNHPNYNIFAPWEPPATFTNRYAWRNSAIYQELIRNPVDKLLGTVPNQTQLRYAEIRALVSGVTAIQGASYQEAGKRETLIRTVDQEILGIHIGAAMIDLPSSDTVPAAEALKKILSDIASGKIKAFYVHLAEGRQDDEETRGEFQRLCDFNALTPATVAIHGVGLSLDQLAALRDQGAKLVWSPQSNLRLYGETTRAADALDLGLKVGIGADWMPSGSHSLLAELRVARRVLAGQGRRSKPREVIEMVTTTAARIAGLGEKLGALLPGRPADVVVLERLASDVYESVLLSDQQNVQAVVIGGDLAYVRQEWADLTETNPETQQVVWAWGRPMMLDTGTQGGPAGPVPAPTLSQLREALIGAYPAIGPVFG